jgi:hypothetical protein
MTEDTFDIRTGMAVYGSDGQKIGSVADIAGFGAARIPGVSALGVAELVIQAKTGSGYFNVDRKDAPSAATGPLCIPFHGIKDVVPDHGVVLNDTIINELAHRQDPRPVVEATPPTRRRRWWPKWL